MHSRLSGRALLLVGVALSVLLGGALSACGSSSVDLPGAQAADEPTSESATSTSRVTVTSRSPTPQLPVTVESSDGRTVTVTDVSRVIPLQGSLAEVVWDLGLGANLVGRDISATFAEVAHLPLVTRAHDVSAESVLALKPSLVLIDEETGPPEAIEHIRNVGVPVVELARPTTLDDIGPRIRAVAEALGVPAAGESLVERTQADLAEVQRSIQSLGPDAADPESSGPPRVAFLYVRGSAGVYLIAGPGSGVDALIGATGAVDAGTAMGLQRPFTPITSEALAQAAPDVILVTTTGLDSVGGVDGLVEIPGIRQTPAGRERRVATIEDGLLFSFGSRTPHVVRDLATRFRRALGE